MNYFVALLLLSNLIVATAGPTGRQTQTVPLHIGTYDDDANHGRLNSPYPAEYSAGSLWELTWIQIRHHTPAYIAKYYRRGGVKLDLYTDAHLCVGGENERQTGWCGMSNGQGGILGAATPGNPNYLQDCQGNALYSTNRAWWLLNPSTVLQYFFRVWDPNGYVPDAYHIDGFNPLGGAQYKNAGNQGGTPGAAAGVCYQGRYATRQEVAQQFGAAGNKWLKGSHKRIILNVLSAGAGCPCYTFAGLERMTGNWETLYYGGAPNEDSGGYAGGRFEYPFIARGAQEPYNTGSQNWINDVNGLIVASNSNLLTVIDVRFGAKDQTSPRSQQYRMYLVSSVDLAVNLPNFFVSEFFVEGRNCISAGPLCTHVYPETELVPMNAFVPLPTNSMTQSTGKGAVALQDPGGAYEREYRDCYYKGSRVGRCAVVVNPQPISVPWPTTLSEDYTTSGSGRSPQRMVLHNGSNCVAGCTTGPPNYYSTATNGADIDSGGYADFTGGPAPTTIPPMTGIIIVDTAK
jgi:hypothetical protein